MNNPRHILALLALLAVASIAGALAIGSAHVSWPNWWAALTDSTPSLAHTILWELRLPRALAAFATGGLLALAGALMQVLLRNPLADPYILGVSGGAASAALLLMLIGAGGTAIAGGAFAGAMLSMLLVFGIAHSRGSWTPTRLLLTGVVVAAGWGALISFLLAVSPLGNLRGMLFWLMGDLVAGDIPWLHLFLLCTVLAISWLLARPLNLLARGEMQARTLGVAVAPLRNTLYILAALSTASAVTLAGSVGFVGLVVPHLLRLAGARDQRVLLPACVLAGGTLLVIADTLARTLWAPQQLPVGILTAAIGIPLFLLLLLKQRADTHT